MKPTPLLLEGLNTGYHSRKETKLISSIPQAAIGEGQVVMLMGPNGSGKSTLLHTISGLLPPLAGQVLIQGQNITKLQPSERAKLLSLVLTDKIEVGNMTVEEVVAIGRHPYLNFRGSLQAEDEVQIKEALRACQLEPFALRLFAELSDGEKQRVMIARALAQQTPLVLLDEPTAHLDLPSRLEIVLMLRSLAGQFAKSFLISTHELDLALAYADLIWLMDRDGRLTIAPPEEIRQAGHLERVFGPSIKTLIR